MPAQALVPLHGPASVLGSVCRRLEAVVSAPVAVTVVVVTVAVVATYSAAPRRFQGVLGELVLVRRCPAGRRSGIARGGMVPRRVEPHGSGTVAIPAVAIRRGPHRLRATGARRPPTCRHTWCLVAVRVLGDCRRDGMGATLEGERTRCQAATLACSFPHLALRQVGSQRPPPPRHRQPTFHPRFHRKLLAVTPPFRPPFIGSETSAFPCACAPGACALGACYRRVPAPVFAMLTHPDRHQLARCRYAAMPGGIPQFAFGTSQSSAGSDDPERAGVSMSLDAMGASMEKTGNPGAHEPDEDDAGAAAAGARAVVGRAVPPLDHKASFRAHRPSRNSIVGLYPNGTSPHDQAGPGSSTSALAAAAVAATMGSSAVTATSAPPRAASFADVGHHAYPPTSLQPRATRTGLTMAATQPNDADDAAYPPMARVAASFGLATSEGFAARPHASGGGDLLSSDSGEYAVMPTQFTTSGYEPSSHAPAAPVQQQHTAASWGIAAAPMPAPVASAGLGHGFARATSGPGFLAAAAPAHAFAGMAGAPPQFMPRAMTQPVPAHSHNHGFAPGSGGQPDVASLQAEVQALRMQLQVRRGGCGRREYRLAG